MIPLHRSIDSSKRSHNPFIWFERYGERHGISRYKWNSIIQYIADKHEMSPDEYEDRVNACYSEVRAIYWIARINNIIESEGHLRYAFIRNALLKNFNMHTVVEKYGSPLTKEVFCNDKTIQLINDAKSRIMLGIL